MIHSNNNTTYYINPSYLTFVENTGYGANLIQVSASSSCYIRVYISGVIGYDGDGNYRKWKVTAYNNRFPDNDAFNIYVRLERDGDSALIVYSKSSYNVDGSTTDGSISASDEYYYILIGNVTATDGTSIREITYDTGRLESDQVKNEGTEINEMWELDKFSSPWLIRAKQWLSGFTVKGFLNLIGGLVFRSNGADKPIVDVKRSVDSDEDVPISDETIPTTKYMEGRHLSKIEPDETPHHIKLMGGVTTTDAVADSVTADSVTAGKVTTPVVDFDINYTDDNGIEHKFVKPVNDIKRSVDSNWEVPISDENVTTSAYLEKRIENLDDRYLSKIKPDETPYHIKLLNGLTTTYAESEDYAEGTEKGGWGINKDIDGYWKGEADKFVARVLGEVYKLVVNNESVFKGSLSSEEFISGFVGGKGWAIRLQEYINAAGENEQRSIAEFDDLIVRGTMRVFEFVINQLLGENDNRVFTGMMEVDHYDADTNKIYLSTKGGKLYNPFRVDDVILVQQYGGDPSEGNDYYVTKQYEFVITGAGIGDKSEGEDRLDWVTFNEFTSTMEGAGVELITKGDTLVRIDNLYDNNRKGIVQIMSVGENTPYIDIIHGAKTDPENSVKGRIGNMGGLYSPLFGWLQEFGAYLVNLYAVGEFRIAHTGEDVSDSIEIAKSLFRTNFRQSSYDMTEEDNFFTNASMTNDCDGWSLAADEDEYFTIDDEPEFFNYELMSSYERFAGIAELNGRDMLRLSVGEAVQDNELIRKPGKHKVFTSTTENEDGSITKNYEEVDDTLYLSIRAYCEASGTLEFGFADADGNFYENNFHKSEELEESVDGYTFNLEGVWDGVGNFVIRSSGDIYLDLISLTDRPLDNFKITTSTSIEQDAQRISLLGKKVNGVEGSVTNLGLELNSAEERITAYVDKEIKGVSASISQLEIDTEGIKTTVAGAQGSADKAQQAADAAQKAADDAAADALAAQKTADAAGDAASDAATAAKNAQSTADSANSKATTNATAIQQNKDSISMIAAAFTEDASGNLVLTSAAGTVITSEVAKTYATKKEVDAVSGDVADINSEISTMAGQISLKAEKTYVDQKVGAVSTSVSQLQVKTDSIESTVAGVQGDVSKAQKAADAAQKAADDAAADALAAQKTADAAGDAASDAATAAKNAQSTADSANSKATTNATAIQQNKDSISMIAAAFTEDASGNLVLTSAAGTVITSEVAKTYATKTTVDNLTGRVSTAESSITTMAGQILLKASQSSVDSLTGRVDTAESNITTMAGQILLKASQSSVDSLTGRVSSAESSITTMSGQIFALSQKVQTDSEGNITNISKSGLVLDSEFASMFSTQVTSQGIAKTASLSAYVLKDELGELVSKIEITADQIDLNGWTSINKTFTIDTEGYMTCIGGTIGGFTIEETMLIAYSADEQRSMTLSSDYIHFTDTDGVQSGNTTVHLGTGGTKDDDDLEFMLSLSSNAGAGVYIDASGVGIYVNGMSNSIISAEDGSTLVTGLRLRAKRVTTSSYTVKLGDDILEVLPIGSYITSVTIYLPTPSTLTASLWYGKVIFLRNLSTASATVSGTFWSSSQHRQETSWAIGNGSHMFVYSLSGWIHYNCSNG